VDICFSELGDDVFGTKTFLRHGFLLFESAFLHNIRLDRFEGGAGQGYPVKIVLYSPGNIQSSRIYHSRKSKFYWHDIEAKKKDIFKDDEADHLGLMHEPHISKWADKLDYYPEEANAGGGSKKTKGFQYFTIPTQSSLR
jgi:hypothetical protein